MSTSVCSLPSVGPQPWVNTTTYHQECSLEVTQFRSQNKDEQACQVHPSSSSASERPVNPGSVVPSSDPSSLHSFDTVLAVLGVYQAARHNWARSSKKDEYVRQAVVDAAGLVNSLVDHYAYLDVNSRQVLDFFLVVWSWKELEVVVPPVSLIAQAPAHGA